MILKSSTPFPEFRKGIVHIREDGVLVPDVKGIKESTRTFWRCVKQPPGVTRQMNKLVIFFLCCIPLAAGMLATSADRAWGERIARYSFAASPLHQFKTDLDQGGSYEMSGVFLHSSFTESVNENVDAGVALRYACEEYRFENPVFTGQARPWSEVHTVQGAFFYVRTMDNGWRMRLSPSIRFSGESGAQTSDAVAWGGSLSFSRLMKPGLTLGAGIAYVDDIDKRSALPIVMVRWDITDRMTLGTAPGSGPAGPAGMELTYRIDDTWTMATGTAWRSQKFRLDRHGFFSGGVARSRCLPVWVRASRSLTGNVSFDFYGGAMLAGSLRIDNARGDRIADDDYASAFFLSCMLSARF